MKNNTWISRSFRKENMWQTVTLRSTCSTTVLPNRAWALWQTGMEKQCNEDDKNVYFSLFWFALDACTPGGCTWGGWILIRSFSLRFSPLVCVNYLKDRQFHVGQIILHFTAVKSSSRLVTLQLIVSFFSFLFSALSLSSQCGSPLRMISKPFKGLDSDSTGPFWL